MPTIDLTTTAPPPALPALEAAPRRLGLTLPELREAAVRAGGAPLPFDPDADSAGRGATAAAATMRSRLGAHPADDDLAAHRAALAGLHDPVDTLRRRGLLADGVLDSGVAGALGLLATPTLAVDLDLRVEQVQVKAWHRATPSALATLATHDGLGFELAWAASSAWADELARVAALPEDVELGQSRVPAVLDLPAELAAAAADAVRTGRTDLVPVLAERYDTRVRDADGALRPDETTRVLTALTLESRGRLRALAADVSGGPVETIGVVSWVLLGDGWRALRPHRDAGEARIEVSAVEPGDLAASLAPAIARVSAGR